MTSERRSPENVADLEAKLRSLPIASTSYDLSGKGQDESWVIRKIRTGWAVFYAERGGDSGWREFAEEADACDYFLRQVRGPSDHVARKTQEDFLWGLQTQMNQLAGVIGADRSLLPASAPRKDGTWLSVYWRMASDGDDEDGWFVALMRNEDGQDWELAEVAVEHTDYILFTVFKDLTWQVARQKSLVTSDGNDARLCWFAAQEELLDRLNPEWSARVKMEHERMISRDGLKT